MNNNDIAISVWEPCSHCGKVWYRAPALGDTGGRAGSLSLRFLSLMRPQGSKTVMWAGAGGMVGRAVTDCCYSRAKKRSQRAGCCAVSLCLTLFAMPHPSRNTPAPPQPQPTRETDGSRVEDGCGLFQPPHRKEDTREPALGSAEGRPRHPPHAGHAGAFLLAQEPDIPPGPVSLLWIPGDPPLRGSPCNPAPDANGVPGYWPTLDT